MSDNSFVGAEAGYLNTDGTNNVFVGRAAGFNNSTGSGNTFTGFQAGVHNTTGSDNTFVGSGAGPDNGLGSLTNATAIGAGARVTQSDSLVLGSNANVGVGNTAPRAKFHVSNGKLYVDAPGQGVVLKSPNGTCYELTVSNSGALTTLQITCP